nr:hypothetical protein CFP56_10725 [Quercus suber]
MTFGADLEEGGWPFGVDLRKVADASVLVSISASVLVSISASVLVSASVSAIMELASLGHNGARRSRPTSWRGFVD